MVTLARTYRTVAVEEFVLLFVLSLQPMSAADERDRCQRQRDVVRHVTIIKRPLSGTDTV